MMHSNRGAARVSAVWLISSVVLFLVAVAFAFIAQSDLAKAHTERDSMQARMQEAQNTQSEQARLKREVSLTLGFVDAESADPVSDLEAAGKALEGLRGAFPDLSEGDATFQEVLPKVTAAYDQRGRTIAELETRIQTLEGELQVARQTLGDVQTQKDQRISELQQEVADVTQNADQRQSELEGRIQTMTSQLSDRDLELRQAKADSQSDRRRLEQEVNRLQTRIGELSKATKFAREPFNQFPDGQVIEVSEPLDLGWIDLGANQRLTRGTRFRVESAGQGQRRLKAIAEVIGVEADRAEVRFVDRVDRFDPVVPGDVVINPLYDPSGERNAVLLGRFSGAYNKRELGLLLSRMGIQVQPQLDLTTHFLIVGSEVWSDPETNEPLEEPIQPSDLPVYKNAEALGVQIIPLQDIREFFRIQSSTTAGA